MPCVHLNQLYQLCRDSQLQLSSADLIHVVCKQCNQAEVCPSMLYEQYDAIQAEKESQSVPPSSESSSGNVEGK